MIKFGGDKCRGSIVKGDIVVFFQYVNGEEAMVITPRYKKGKAGAFVICMSVAFKYVDSVTGMPTPYLFEQSAKAIDVIGMEQSPFLLHRMADLICECLPELVNMKPEKLDESPEKKSYGTGLITADGISHEFELN